MHGHGILQQVDMKLCNWAINTKIIRELTLKGTGSGVFLQTWRGFVSQLYPPLSY